MKKILRFIATGLLIMTSSLAFSQWNYISSLESGVVKVFTLDENHAYFVGYNGLFYKTDDGGLTWTQKVTGTTQSLTDVEFLDPDNGYICGWSGTLLKTTNGGDTWTPLTTGLMLNFTSLDFGDVSTGWISASSMFSDAGAILYTADGGTNFETDDTFTFGFAEIAAISNDTIFAIGNDNTNGYVVRSVDMGQNWVTVYSPDNHDLKSIEVSQDGLVYVSAAANNFYRSSDFGTTWVPVVLPVPMTVSDMSFTSEMTGFAAGSDMFGGGTINYTTDAGDSWITQASGETFTTVDVVMAEIGVVDYTIGFAGSTDGKVYKYAVATGVKETTNAGISITPNPVTDYIVINTGKSETLSVEIFSMQGSKILEREIISGSAINNLGNLAAGVYTVKITTAAGTFAGKFIRE